MDHFRCMIQEEAKTRGGFNLSRPNKDFNVLQDATKYWLCVLVLWSDDGKQDHAIAIANGWLFDSNFKKALELTIENLDECCSSDDHKCKFAGITGGWLVTCNISKKNRHKKGKGMPKSDNT